MSTPPRNDDQPGPERRPITLTKLGEMRALGEPIVMVTAYDHPSAKVAETAGVDIVLVGDSAANNVLGYADTVPITGISTRGISSVATAAGIASNTSAKQPASWSASASSSTARARCAVRPWAR